MPIYEYKCECSPETVVSFERKIVDPEPDYPCDQCGKTMTRHYGSFGIQFKGGGFYKTDNAK